MYSLDEYTELLLTDLLFDSNLSYREIAEEISLTESQVRAAVKQLGLGWVRRSRGYASRGQAALMSIMRKLVPGEAIAAEEPLGDRLKLDVYCPKFQLAAEYHGRQHFQYVEFFHQDMRGFEDHRRRDERKVELCKQLGIALVIFRYTDELTEDAVFRRLLDAMESTPWVEPERKSLKGNPYYEAYKQRQREYRRYAYQKMKKSARRSTA